MEDKKFLTKMKELALKYKKIIFGVIIVIVAVSTFISLRPDGYEKVYSNLSDEDKQAIIVELSKRGIDYKLDETGLNLSVKKENVSVVRQEMNDLGLPSSSSETQGYELFLENSLGTTSEQQALKELAARKGQLESELVKSFPFIETAKVNFNVPEDESIFEKEEKTGTASVTIGFKRGTNITKQQLLGIQNMVSSALPNIKPEDVKVIDTEKGIISDDIANEDETGSSAYEKQMAIEKQAETNIHDDIKRSLSSLFGYDNVQINVKTTINFDEIVQNIEKYGDDGVLRSRNKQSESNVTSEGASAPEAGTEANGEVVGYDVNSEDGNIVSQQKKDNIIENFEISKTVEKVRKHPELTNTNVVVWVNQAALQQRQINVDQFRESIGLAAGLEYNQQDKTFTNGQVSVLFLDFQEEPKEKEVKEKEKTGIQGFLDKYGLYLIIGLAVLFIVAGIIIFLLIRKKKKREAEEAARQAAEAILRDQEKRALQEAKLTAKEEDDDAENGEDKPRSLNLIIEDSAEENETEEEREIRIKRENRHKELTEQVANLSNGYPKETAEYIKKLLNGRK